MRFGDAQSFATFLLSLPVFLSSCTHPPGIELGKAAFHFDYRQVNQFILTRTDPIQGTQWTAQAEKQGLTPQDWMITLPPGGMDLQDRRANGAWIEHLLDTLRSLVPVSKALEGPLSTFGLQPPRYGIRWKVSSGRSEKYWEALIGDPPSPSPEQAFTAYCVVTDRPQAPEALPEVVLIKGPVLPVLSALHTFDDFRQRSFALIQPDDFDEIEIFQPGKRSLYAQRQGAAWVDRADHPTRWAGAALELLATASVQSFIDERATTQRILRHLSASTLRAVLKDRHGRPTEIHLTLGSEGVIGAVSTRAGAVFQLQRDLIARLSGLL